jgi:hypothetical protein
MPDVEGRVCRQTHPHRGSAPTQARHPAHNAFSTVATFHPAVAAHCSSKKRTQVLKVGQGRCNPKTYQTKC